MRTRPVFTLVAALAFGFCAVDGAAAQAIVARQRCQTTFQGVPYQGLMQIERWSHHGTHRVYGRFHDPAGTLVEMEVFTNQPAGVGGLWVNYARHRETRIHLQRAGNGYLVRTEDGAATRLACR
jgi:hypothetical protein